MHSLYLFVSHLSPKTSPHSFIVMHFVIWTTRILLLGLLSLRGEKQRLKSYSTAGERERDRQTVTQNNTRVEKNRARTACALHLPNNNKGIVQTKMKSISSIVLLRVILHVISARQPLCDINKISPLMSKESKSMSV